MSFRTYWPHRVAQILNKIRLTLRRTEINCGTDLQSLTHTHTHAHTHTHTHTHTHLHRRKKWLHWVGYTSRSNGLRPEMHSLWLAVFTLHEYQKIVQLWIIIIIIMPPPLLSTKSRDSSPPLQVNGFSASQEIPCILRKMKVHYSFQNSPPIISHTNPVHTFTSYSFKVYFIVLSSILTPSKWSRSFTFPNTHAFLLSLRATYPAHLIPLDFITRIIFGAEHKS